MNTEFVSELKMWVTLLVSGVVSILAEPVGLFPSGVEAHGGLVLQEVIHPAGPVGGAASKALLLREAH